MKTKHTFRTLAPAQLARVVGSEGTLPFAEGTLPFAEGTLPFADGTLPIPKAEGTLPFAKGNGSTTVYLSGSTTVY